jgi:hypothetical protein
MRDARRLNQLSPGFGPGVGSVGKLSALKVTVSVPIGKAREKG